MLWFYNAVELQDVFINETIRLLSALEILSYIIALNDLLKFIRTGFKSTFNLLAEMKVLTR